MGRAYHVKWGVGSREWREERSFPFLSEKSLEND
jgi:hypothetical protein